jgi:antitoxin component of MazEF toxin-antitoxin module
MPDDHSELEPPLPIPNRTVKRLHADDSAATSVKVGNRQAVTCKKPRLARVGASCFCASTSAKEFETNERKYRKQRHMQLS